VTQLLKQAFDEASRLGPSEQDALARLLLDEIESERAWDERFAQSAEQLGKLADEALDEHRRGRTRPLDPEILLCVPEARVTIAQRFNGGSPDASGK